MKATRFIVDGMGPITQTRFAEISIAKCGNVWRFVNFDSDGSAHVVGPHMRSKIEALADLERYAREFGCAA